MDEVKIKTKRLTLWVHKLLSLILSSTDYQCQTRKNALEKLSSPHNSHMITV